jgi:hypothetical protein
METQIDWKKADVVAPAAVQASPPVPMDSSRVRY